MKNIAVLVSGGGTNLQALIDLKEQKTIRLQLRLSEEKTMPNLMNMILL